LVNGKKSVTQCNGVATSAGGEATLGRGNGVDDTNWADVNLTEPKNEEDPHGRFSYIK
jgi:hypothetical protein